MPDSNNYSIDYAGNNANLTKDILDYALQSGIGAGSQGAWYLAPNPDEGFDDYVKRQKLSPDNIARLKPFFMKYNRLGSKPNTMAQNAAGSVQAAPGSDYEQEMMNFYRLMMNPNAPELQQARALGVNAMQKNVGARGLRGGLSDAGVLKAGADSYNQALLQRQGLGYQALAGASNRGLGLSAQGLSREAMLFDQNQSNMINRANQERAQLQALTQAGGQLANLGVDLAKSGLRNNAQGYNPYDFSGSNMNTPEWKDPMNYPSNPSDWNPYPGSGPY